MIKVGQFLSSRIDVLPDEFIGELALLQDEVPPEKYEAIVQLAEEELGGSLSEVFDSFQEIPLAAASLGQVHRATLKPDKLNANTSDAIQHVVVKIQRPKIRSIIATDLAALRKVGGWINRYKPVRKRANIPVLLDEFSRILYQEIDYINEGRNAETIAGNLHKFDVIKIPKVIWEYTTTRVLTLEDVYAIKITDYQAITQAGIDRKEVASLLVDIYLHQIFTDHFFHADPHPGNLFVSPNPDRDPDSPDWLLTFVDFGMVGQVPERLREGLREMAIALGTKDSQRLVRSYQTLGLLLPWADLKLLERAEYAAFEMIWGKSMQELKNISHKEIHELGHEFKQILYSMPFQVPEEFILLGRTVAILSGMCTGLDPEFNLWEHLQPFTHKLMEEETGQKWEIWLNEIGQMAKLFLSLPRQLDQFLLTASQGEFEVKTPQISRQLHSIEMTIQRLAWAVIFASLFTGGLILRGSGDIQLSTILLIVSGFVLIWALLPRHQ